MARGSKIKTVYRKGKRKVRHGRKMTLSLAVVSGLSVPVVGAYTNFKSGGIQNAMYGLTASMTGYNPGNGTFAVSNMRFGLVPVMIGAFVHKLAGTLGVNRAIAAAGIPFIRI